MFHPSVKGLHAAAMNCTMFRGCTYSTLSYPACKSSCLQFSAFTLLDLPAGSQLPSLLCCFAKCVGVQTQAPPCTHPGPTQRHQPASSPSPLQQQQQLPPNLIQQLRNHGRYAARHRPPLRAHPTDRCAAARSTRSAPNASAHVRLQPSPAVHVAALCMRMRTLCPRWPTCCAPSHLLRPLPCKQPPGLRSGRCCASRRQA